MSKLRFTDRTFAYFDGAAGDQADPAWFEHHSDGFERDVEMPFLYLIATLGEVLSP